MRKKVYVQAVEVRGCKTSNEPVPPSTTRPTTILEEGESSVSKSPCLL